MLNLLVPWLVPLILKELEVIKTNALNSEYKDKLVPMQMDLLSYFYVFQSPCLVFIINFSYDHFSGVKNKHVLGNAIKE